MICSNSDVPAALSIAACASDIVSYSTSAYPWRKCETRSIGHSAPGNRRGTHFHITRSSIEIQVKVFYFAIISEFIRNIFFSCLFVNIGNEHDPAFYSCNNIEVGVKPVYIKCLHRAALVSVSLFSTRSYVCSVVTVLSFPPEIKVCILSFRILR